MSHSMEFEKALAFINSIGIETSFADLRDSSCFLPGLHIENGCILIDSSLLENPGDILHEAAHIALVSSNERNDLNAATIEKRKDAAAEEMAAIAWTFAACIFLELDPSFVFHETGYKGDASSIATNFKNGNYFGVPILQWFGLTGSNGFAYPKMIKWTRE